MAVEFVCIIRMYVLALMICYMPKEIWPLKRCMTCLCSDRAMATSTMLWRTSCTCLCFWQSYGHQHYAMENRLQLAFVSGRAIWPPALCYGEQAALAFVSGRAMATSTMLWRTGCTCLCFWQSYMATSTMLWCNLRTGCTCLCFWQSYGQHYAMENRLHLPLFLAELWPPAVWRTG